MEARIQDSLVIFVTRSYCTLSTLLQLRAFKALLESPKVETKHMHSTLHSCPDTESLQQ